MQRQAQLALFILFVCISIEIAGEPYRIVTKRHEILGRLELASLFTLFLTMWCGLMIFASQAPGEESFVVFISFVVAFINVGTLLLMGVRLVAEYGFENKDSKVGKFFRRGMRSIQGHASFKRKGIGNTGLEIEMTSTADDSATAAAAAAMSVSARWKRVSAVCRVNALYKKTSRKYDDAMLAGDDVSPNPLSADISPSAQPVSADNWIRAFDATSSRWYFYNEASGQSKWDEDEATVGASATSVENAVAAEEGKKEKKTRAGMRPYSKFETDEGKAYFVPSSGGAAVWDLPPGASVVTI